MVSKYTTTWSQIQEQMNEFTLVHVARWKGKDGKRYASPFKTKDSAEKKAKELRSQGNSEVSVTQDTLRGNIKWAKDGGPDIKGMQKEAIVEDGHTDVPSSKRMAQVISEDAQLILKELEKKSEEESLPTWWTNKLATSAHNMNAARDYISNDIKESSDGYIVKFANSKGAKIASAWYKDEESAKKALESIRKNGGNGIISKGKMNEELEEGYKTVGNEKGTEWKVFKDGKLIKTFSTYIQAHDYVKQQKEDLDEAMSPEQIKKLKDSWSDIKLMSPEKVKTLKNFLDKYSTDTLMQLAQSGINFVSNMARSVAMRRKTATPKHAGSHKTHSVKEETKTDNEKIADLRVRQMQLQTKTREMDPTKDKTDLEITKNKLDNIQLRMDKIKSKNEEVHPAKALIEAIEAVKNKAEKTGMPYSILKKVYDRGMAAWKGGHRPGTTPQQWALARVNSFVTKSSGTWGGADSDLAKKVRSKK